MQKTCAFAAADSGAYSVQRPRIPRQAPAYLRADVSAAGDIDDGGEGDGSGGCGQEAVKLVERDDGLGAATFADHGEGRIGDDAAGGEFGDGVDVHAEGLAGEVAEDAPLRQGDGDVVDLVDDPVQRTHNGVDGGLDERVTAPNFSAMVEATDDHAEPKSVLKARRSILDARKYCFDAGDEGGDFAADAIAPKISPSAVKAPFHMVEKVPESHWPAVLSADSICAHVSVTHVTAEEKFRDFAVISPRRKRSR